MIAIFVIACEDFFFDKRRNSLKMGDFFDTNQLIYKTETDSQT